MTGTTANRDLRVAGRASGLRGRVRAPSDKSISQRALLLGALADGETRISRLLASADVDAMRGALAALGATISLGDDTVTIRGFGSMEMRPGSGSPLADCAESGTAARLLLGALAGRGIDAIVSGTGSLLSRPMRRVVAPLLAMGARIEGADLDRLPLRVLANARLEGRAHVLDVASAQVKSALLLAGLGAAGETVVHEPGASRDHTERMLRSFGVEVTIGERDPAGAGEVRLRGPQRPRAAQIEVPADVSSALYCGVAALLLEDSAITLADTGVNPTRFGAVRVLRRMGARIESRALREFGGEPVADLVFESSELHGVAVSASEFPTLIDDVPILAIAAACAVDGVTTFAGAGELRVKESDRLASIMALVRAIGGDASIRGDSLVIAGGTKLRGGVIDSAGDHRIALAGTIGALAATGESLIQDHRSVAKSYPGIVDDLVALAVEPDRFRA